MIFSLDHNNASSRIQSGIKRESLILFWWIAIGILVVANSLPDRLLKLRFTIPDKLSGMIKSITLCSVLESVLIPFCSKSIYHLEL